MTDLSPKDSSPRDTFDLTMVIQLITRIKEVWFSKRGIYSMLICVLLGISIGGGIAWFDEPKYLAITTFLTEEKSGGAGLSGMMALASQFGIGAAGKDETQKLLELLKSRVIFEKACMDTVEIEGVRDLIINHYLKHTDYGQELREKPVFANLQFFPGKPMGIDQTRLLNALHGNFLKYRLEIEQKKTTAFLKLIVRTENEELSEQLSKHILQAVNEYHIETSTRKQRNIYEIFKHRADSLKVEIEVSEQLMAASADRNILSHKMEQRIDVVRLKREIVLLNAIYTEVLKNLEMTRFSLLNETPVINIIDEPRYPLPQEKAQLLIWIIGGGIIGLLLSAFVLLGIALRQSVLAFLR